MTLYNESIFIKLTTFHAFSLFTIKVKAFLIHKACPYARAAPRFCQWGEGQDNFATESSEHFLEFHPTSLIEWNDICYVPLRGMMWVGDISPFPRWCRPCPYKMHISFATGWFGQHTFVYVIAATCLIKIMWYLCLYKCLWHIGATTVGTGLLHLSLNLWLGTKYALVPPKCCAVTIHTNHFACV